MTLSLEQRLARAIIGQDEASAWMVDAYKIAMTQSLLGLITEGA